MSTSPKPVLIIGAGLGGLTLAHGLQRNNIPFLVFERDVSASSRSQGYRIRIHDAGLTALRECLPEDVYKGFEGTCGRNPEAGAPMFGRYDARTGEQIFGGGAGRGGGPAPTTTPSAPTSNGPPRPHAPQFSLPADRQEMRAALLRGLPSPIYNKTFQSYTITPSGVLAHFADGTSSPEGSLLVGADGIYSHVAQQLIGPNATPRDTGARMVYGKTPLVDGLEDKLLPGMKQGLFLAVDKECEGGTLILFMETMHFAHEGAPQDYIYWVLGCEPASLNITDEELRNASPQEAALLSKSATSEWSALIRPVFEYQAAEHSAVLKMTTAHPTALPVWKSEARVTVLGDAIHQMPPTGGSGANTALQDVALLVKCLSETSGENGWGADVIEGYEKTMRESAQEVVKRSYGAAVGFFGVKPLPDVKI